MKTVLSELLPAFAVKKLKSSQLVNDVFVRKQGIQDFEFKGDDVRSDLINRYGFEGVLSDLYCEPSAYVVHKWHHYLPIYEHHFLPWRDTAVRFLEIGVSGGGSLSLWRKFLGKNAIIFGIDINEHCAQFDGIDGSVRIGSQDDPAFLQSVIDEMGGIDIVLDDGSHVMGHIKASLEFLLPRLGERGIYMIEDLHTAYWGAFGGGYYRRGNFFNYVRELIDDMHQWYHVSELRHPTVSNHVGSIQIYDSVCVIGKAAVQRPTHSYVQLKNAVQHD